MLKFKIFSTAVKDGPDKKHVLYKYCITLDSEVTDKNPSYIERRYTHFLDLFNKLKKESPSLMSDVNFPKRVMVGNFKPVVVLSRSVHFCRFLKYITNESSLRNSACTVSFFHKIELDEAKALMADKEYSPAFNILENIFTLLDKIYTNHSYIVLIALCRLIACGAENEKCESASFAGPSEKWANKALKRFECVCDTDILSLYVPLIYACIFIRQTLGKEVASLENKLEAMRKKGMRVDNNLSLMAAIDKLEAVSDDQ